MDKINLLSYSDKVTSIWIEKENDKFKVYEQDMVKPGSEKILKGIYDDERAAREYQEEVFAFTERSIK